MIADRVIEQGTLRSNGHRSSVEVRIPWYRALPGSCIAGAKLAIDGVEAPVTSLRWEMNGEEYTFDELRDKTDEWWFPQDSVVLSGEIELEIDDREHEVEVELHLYIPYIIISDTEVLRIEERASKTMKVVESR